MLLYSLLQMLFFENFGAWISIDGVRHIEEYGVDMNYEEKTVTCYIASEEGKNFQVHWYDKSFESPTRGRVYIDGRSMGGKIISQSTVDRSAVKKGYRTSAKKRVPFVFSKLKLTDDEDLVSASRETPGEIDLIIIRVRLRGLKMYNRSQTAPETLEFNEKDFKGAAHNTTFGEPVIDSSIVLEHDTEPYGDPIARFCFRYMPIDLLRAKDIIPPAPKIEEEETKAWLRASFATNVPGQLRSVSSDSTVGSETDSSAALISRGSTVTLIDSSTPLKRTVKREFSLSFVDPSPARAVKQERKNDGSVFTGLVRAVKRESVVSTSFRKPAIVVPTSPEIIDLTDL